jgi:hypothetical protein
MVTVKVCDCPALRLMFLGDTAMDAPAGAVAVAR